MEEQQWLWSFDGIVLRRDAAGQIIYTDQKTGEVLPSRPEALPAEAYASRLRRPAHSDWLSTPETRKGGGLRHVCLIRHSQYNTPGMHDAQDLSHELRKNKYWASFNRPYFEKIRVETGHDGAQKSHGALYSYDENPR